MQNFDIYPRKCEIGFSSEREYIIELWEENKRFKTVYTQNYHEIGSIVSNWIIHRIIPD